MKYTILFLAANPLGTDRLALDREARAIQEELERSGFRDSFVLETRWAAQPLDLLRGLRKLKPMVVHFSGHGSSDVTRARRGAAGQHREVLVEDYPAAPGQHGLYFQGPDGRPQLVSTEALAHVFDAAGSSVKLVVLNACYSEPQAATLLTHVDCVVGMHGSIRDDAARSFAIGFYGGLGERESVAAAYKQGCAAIDLEGLSEGDRPQLKSRQGIDVARLVLASPLRAGRPRTAAATTPRPDLARLARLPEDHETCRPQPCDAGAMSPQTAVGTQPVAGRVRRSKAKKVAAPPPAHASAEVSRHMGQSSRLRLTALGATAVAAATAIYIGMSRHPTLRVDLVAEKYILTSDPNDPDSPQTIRVVIKPVVDGRQGDDCFAQASESRSFVGPPGNVLEAASSVFEDHYECEQNKWNFMIRLANRPHVEVWRGWVRIALRRGNQIFESEPIAVDATTAAETLAPTQRSATR